MTMQEPFFKICQDLYEIWNDDLEELYVTRDLVRLANKFVIRDIDEEGNVKEIRFDKPQVDHEYLTELLNTISNFINEKFSSLNIPESPMVTVEEFKEKIPKIQRYDLFTNFLKTKYGEQSYLVKMLKLCEQGVVISYIGELGLMLMKETQMRTKDVRGNWNFIIEKRNDNTFTISHRRTEQLLVIKSTVELVESCQFSWRMEIVFDDTFLKFKEVSAVLLDVDWMESEKDEAIEANLRRVFGAPNLKDIKENQLSKKNQKEEEKKRKLAEKKKKKTRKKFFGLF